MTTITNSNAFVDFYNTNNIIPVSQDLSDVDSFRFRRNHLYQTLGLPLARIKNLNVIEFGPGGGYNAVATSWFRPKNLILVDATTAAIAELHKKQSAGHFRAENVEIVESNIFNYNDSRRYDLVICEGTIPGQNDPRGMLRKVGSFCEPGGLLFTTTTSASSMLSEVCRRLLRPAIMTPKRTFAEQTQIAAALFRKHLKNLTTSTRPVEDWVQDVILHNWHTGEYVFTMIDVITTLEEDFEFYFSSPRFLFDDRWYKQVTPGSLRSRDLLRQQYPLINACFLDFRMPLKTILQIKDLDRLSSIEDLSKSACVIHNLILEENTYDHLDDFVGILAELIKTLPVEFDITKDALGDFITGILETAGGNSRADFCSFEKWWGRGQQYLSLVKTAA